MKKLSDRGEANFWAILTLLLYIFIIYLLCICFEFLFFFFVLFIFDISFKARRCALMTGCYDPDDIGGFSNGMSLPPEILQFHSNGIRNLSFGTPLFNGHKIWSRKDAHIVFESVTFIVETPLFRGKGHLFWVPKPRFNLHSADTFTLKRH